MSNTKNMMPAKQDSALARVALMMPESMLIRLKEEADRRASSVSQIVRDSVFERFERMDREARTNNGAAA